MGDKRLTLVLFSGGWESALCAAVACKRAERTGTSVHLAFLDYGQAYMEAERVATMRLSHRYFPHATLHSIYCRDALQGLTPGVRFVPDRNEQLLRIALRAMELDGRPVHRVYVGARGLCNAVDPYRDSNRQWASAMGRKYSVRVHTPAFLHPKWAVRWRVQHQYDIDPSLIFSSEGLPS